MKRNPDFIVGTTGRIMDMIQKGSLSLNTIETLVLDEADRMLDMGFKPDIDKILEYMGRKGEF